jgi:hypothetical protein
MNKNRGGENALPQKWEKAPAAEVPIEVSAACATQ